MKILSLPEIKTALNGKDLIPEIESAFVAYSKGEAVVPPVGELLFDNPPGDVHIKYGYLRNDKYYVLKVASGFYENPALGISSNNGLMLVFDKQTGQPEAILLDEGYLTDVRTALAGAIAAKYLGKKTITCIGIAGTGTQALLQLLHLKQVTQCRKALIWGRSNEKRRTYLANTESLGFDIATTAEADELLSQCDLIVTTTATTEPILHGNVRPGTHITAVGSDTPYKQELSTSLLKCADLIVADSIEQCTQRGEIHHAISDQSIQPERVVELGDVISGAETGRTFEEQISIADLTGVAVQDISIAKAVLEAANKR